MKTFFIVLFALFIYMDMFAGIIYLQKYSFLSWVPFQTAVIGGLFFPPIFFWYLLEKKK